MGSRGRLAASIGFVLLAIGVTAGAAAASDKTAPPNSKAFGKSLTEWTSLYFERAFTAGSDTAKRVKLLPIPVGQPQGGGSFTSSDPGTLVGAADVTLKPGTPFILPVAIWYGESYNTGQEDDAELDRSVFTGSNVLVRVDGTAIIDSNVDDLARWYIGPEYFDPPIVYDQPTSYGSISANFVQGLSFAHRPLSRGDHVLTLESEIIAFVPDYYGPGVDLDIGVRFRNSWTIHVTK
jgi:hypothetical protein